MMTEENIYLVGMPGAGKSAIGRHLARELGREFVDADAELEKRTGAAIATIFAIEGEARFRRREAEVLRDLGRRAGLVVATGGGAVLAAENRAVMRGGFVVYLETLPEILKQRAARNTGRPLLDDTKAQERGEKIEQLLQTRAPLYSALAHLVVTPGRSSAQAAAQEIALIMAKKPCTQST